MFGGTIGYGDSYLECFFRHFKLFRQHAKQHDAAGAVRSYSGERPGYCYIAARGQKPFLFGHVSGQIFTFT